MQLIQLRTFLEVCQTRHFGRAAENLNVTTSAVSARIRLMEQSLSTQLFVRLRHDVQLTDAANRLIPYCRSMLKTWEQARFSALVEADPRPNLTILAAPGLWESVDANWIKRFISANPDVRLRLETAYSPQVFSRLHSGDADLVLVMEPHASDDVRSEKVGEIALSLVCDTPNTTAAEVMASGYMHVNWSTSFTAQFMAFFPDYLQADITVSTAKIAADLLIEFPGAAYLSQYLIERLSPFVMLYPVADAPTFHVPVYAIHASSSMKAELIKNAIDCFSFK